VSKRAKIYQLFGSPGGKASSQSVDYRGRMLDVLAFSSKQAHYFARNETWAGGPDEPLGIVQYYDKHDDGGYSHFWDGCRSRDDLGVGHGASRTATVKAMRKHLQEQH
jgi:hypothetical protein